MRDMIKAKLLDVLAPLLGARVTAPHGIGGQCVDLANVWAIALGADEEYADAIDWQRVASRSQWTWTPNGPANYPMPGDIVIWNETPAMGIGPDGHVAIVLAANSTTLAVAEQNWAYHQSVTVRSSPYLGVAGWLRRR